MNPISMLFSTPGLFVLFVLLIFLYIYYRFGYAPFFYFSKQGIPGPKPKPFIGSLDLIRRFNGNTVALNTHLVKTYGPVCGIYFGPKPFLFITDLDMIKDITVKQFDKFVDRADSAIGLKVTVDGKQYDGVFATSNDDWRKRRHFLSPAFSAHKMKLMDPLIKESTVHLAEKIFEVSEKEVEILTLYSRFSMEVILAAAFGRSVDVQGGKGGEIYKDARDLFKFFTGKQAMAMRIAQFLMISAPRLTPILRPFLRLSGALSTLPRLTEGAIKMVELRKKEGNTVSRKDLLQLMIDATGETNQNRLHTGEIVADAVGFMFAGHETTSITLVFATYVLGAYPEVQEKLANEIHDYFEENPDKSMYDATHELEYLEMFFCETMRMYPPAPATLRLCNEECVVNDVTIKPGVQVFFPIYDIHMNPENYAEPEKFIPERFSPEEKTKHHPCAYLPFGYGPRNCVGMRFAIMTAKMAIIEIVKNFKIELSPDTKVPLEIDIGVTLRPKEKIHATFHPRQ